MRSLEYWNTQEDIPVFDAICLWLDYVPRVKLENQEYPNNWGAIYRLFVALIRHGELIARTTPRYEGLPESFKNFPFDKPVNYDDYVDDMASQKKGIFYSLWSLVKNLGFGEDVGLRGYRREYPIHITYVKKADLKRIADGQTAFRPLFLYPDIQKGNKLSDMWPEKPAINSAEKKAEPAPIAPTVKTKPNKPKARRKKILRQNPQPIKPKRVLHDIKSRKWKIKILHDEINAIIKELLIQNSSITISEIAKFHAIVKKYKEYQEMRKSKTNKTLLNWIRAELKNLGYPPPTGRPQKKKLAR